MVSDMAKKNRKRTQPNKRPAKKMTRRRRKTDQITFDPASILSIDQVYKAINRVQTEREGATFIVHTSEAVVLENIIKDLSLKYEKNTTVIGCANCTQYTLIPPPEDNDDRDFTDIEEFPDEIAEEGQLFFD